MRLRAALVLTALLLPVCSARADELEDVLVAVSKVILTHPDVASAKEVPFCIDTGMQLTSVSAAMKARLKDPRIRDCNRKAPLYVVVGPAKQMYRDTYRVRGLIYCGNVCFESRDYDVVKDGKTWSVHLNQPKAVS